jgi:hypothetical protein
MFAPALHAWVEQWHQAPFYRINCRKVRAFTQIALHTSKRQILFRGAPSMFERNQVVDMVRKVGIILMQQAILAASPCSLYNQSA